MLSGNIAFDEQGRLQFAECDVQLLARRYGTPLYLMDEERIRSNCRMYLDTLQEVFGENASALYACKAACFKKMLEIVKQEGMELDVVSSGEILTAVRAGYPMEKVHFHSNNKTPQDIDYAMDQGVGVIVVDQSSELTLVSEKATQRGIKQRILIRVTPGIDTHTYEAVNTGKVDSKFGFALETGQAMDAIKAALLMPGIQVDGFHCHIGSQVFMEDVFERSAEVMLGFLDEVRKVTGYTAQVLDLGGGYGVRYVESDPIVSIPDKIRDLGKTIFEVCETLNYPRPRILLEPGRSIVADAGMTLYTVGNVKRIPGYKNYVSVDGGMTDNPRYALYQSQYTVLPMQQSDAELFTCDVVGRCCESGDIIQPEVQLPSDLTAGQGIAVCTTGAYNFSMASNYNRIPRPPVVMLNHKKDTLAVRGETLEDLVALDL